MRRVFNGFSLVLSIVGNAMMLPKVLLVAGVASWLAIILADCSPTIEVPAVDVVCPVRCEDMFGKLVNGVQEVHVQIRGGEQRGPIRDDKYSALRPTPAHKLRFYNLATRHFVTRTVSISGAYVVANGHLRHRTNFSVFPLRAATRCYWLQRTTEGTNLDCTRDMYLCRRASPGCHPRLISTR